MKEKQKAILVGLGTISKEYNLGIKTAPSFSLVALVDFKIDAVGVPLFKNLPFYYSLKEALINEECDLVIISTPPSSHYRLIKLALENKKNVICEKPALLNYEEFDELHELAKKNNVQFNISYHWQNGQEVKAFNQKYDMSKINSIAISANDPYSQDGINIDDNKKHLEGAWIDSGVNALSMVKLWLPFASFTIKDMDVIFAKNIHQPIYAKVKLLIDSVPVSIEVDWRHGVNKKISYLKYDSRDIVIDHSNQTIIDGENKYQYDDMPRLTRHYYNYFTSYQGVDNFIESKLIHKVLLEVVKEYEKKFN